MHNWFILIVNVFLNALWLKENVVRLLQPPPPCQNTTYLSCQWNIQHIEVVLSLHSRVERFHFQFPNIRVIQVTWITISLIQFVWQLGILIYSNDLYKNIKIMYLFKLGNNFKPLSLSLSPWLDLKQITHCLLPHL